MMNVSRFGSTAVLVVVSGVLLVSLGCGSGSSGNSSITKAAATSLVVADGSNSRILIYNAPFSTDESASIVLGQPDFTQRVSGVGGAASATTLFYPAGLAKDSAGDLYVASGCQVLQFQPPFATGMSATVLIGPPFTENAPVNCSSPASVGASSMVFDSKGNLWLTEINSGRVTEYVPPFTGGMSATLAIGQPSLENTSPCNGMDFGKGDTYPPPTANTLCEPLGATFDSKGNLWVADLGNQRVLEFVPPFSTGMAASLELGQPAATAFTSNGFATETASSLHAPNALTFDSSGNLWVADTEEGRVLEYVPPFSNGMAATMVIGEVGFGPCTQNCNSLNANTVGTAVALTFDSSGNLIVADNTDNRVLIFAPPFSNGMAATTVIGQTNMTSGAENQGDSASPTASTLWGPGGVLTF